MTAKVEMPATLKRKRIFVQGIVQGVGFRPFVYGLANELGLAGFVLNDDCGVTIEVEGPSPKIESFTTALTDRAPPLARVNFLSADSIALKGEMSFAIIASKAGKQHRTLTSPDVAICDDCFAELLDSNNRRFQYPFHESLWGLNPDAVTFEVSCRTGEGLTNWTEWLIEQVARIEESLEDSRL